MSKIKNIVENILNGCSLKESVLMEATENAEKIQALIQFLDLTEKDADRITVASYNDNVYSLDGKNDFLICTDDEADSEYAESLAGLIDEMGLSLFSEPAKSYILENFCDNDAIDEFYRDDVESYARDIFTETQAPETYPIKDRNGELIDFDVTNRLFIECVENNCIDTTDFSLSDFNEDGDFIGDEDTLVEAYLSRFNSVEDQGYDNGYEWLEFSFGKQYADEFIQERDLVDIDKIIDYVKESDGRGNELNHWDGAEYEEDVNGHTYYIYPDCDYKELRG